MAYTTSTSCCLGGGCHIGCREVTGREPACRHCRVLGLSSLRLQGLSHSRSPQVVDFYEFYEGLQEGWDGPALLVFSDGHHVGARLDRNGLRPARFWQTSDGYIFVASEVRHRAQGTGYRASQPPILAWQGSDAPFKMRATMPGHPLSSTV